ncbi:MAG: aspartyl protease family protein [Snowella sp.]|nr:aspartyl protease family protein [Snowella sp.]
MFKFPAFLIAAIAWGGLAFSPFSFASANPQPLPTQQFSKTRSLSYRLKAIIRLTNTKLPSPRTTGQGIVPLNYLKDGIAWTVEVKVGQQTATFLLDTGASMSMVSPNLTKKLGLTGKPLPPEETRFAVAGNECKEMKAAIYALPPISLGQAQIQGLHALQLSQAVIPENLDGILGMDALRYFNLRLDPVQKTLELLPPSPIPNRDRAQAIPLLIQDNVPLVEVKINDSVSYLFLVDTGAESTFISPKIAKQLQLPPDAMQPVQVQGFCGLEPANYTALGKVQVGNQHLNQVEAVVLQNTAVLESLKVDGILGQNFLNAFHQSWYFNSRVSTKTHKALILTPLN